MLDSSQLSHAHPALYAHVYETERKGMTDAAAWLKLTLATNIDTCLEVYTKVVLVENC